MAIPGLQSTAPDREALLAQQQALKASRELVEAAKAQAEAPTPPPMAPPTMGAPASPVATTPAPTPATPPAPAVPSPPVVAQAPAPTSPAAPAMDTTAWGRALSGQVEKVDLPPEIAPHGKSKGHIKGVANAAKARAAATVRMERYLQMKGMDEPIPLQGENVDLGAIRRRLESAYLEQAAKEMGASQWLAVPDSPEKYERAQQVADEVARVMGEATTIGRGAIFVSGAEGSPLEDLLAELPWTFAMQRSLATALPGVDVTYTPSGVEFKAEGPASYLLRQAGAITALGSATGQQFMASGAPREIAEATTLSEGVSAGVRGALMALGSTDPREWESARDALMADPKAGREIVENIQKDEAAFQFMDQVAKDLAAYYELDEEDTINLRVPFLMAGAGVDIFTPDPATPAFALIGELLRAGTKLDDAGDLLAGARDIAAIAGKTDGTFEGALAAARQRYPGLDKALEIHAAYEMGLPTSVLNQHQGLVKHVAKLDERIVKAEQAVTASRDAAEQAARAQEVTRLRLEREAALYQQRQVEQAVAVANERQWAEQGGAALRESVKDLRAAESYTREADYLEKALKVQEEVNGPLFDKLQRANESLSEVKGRYEAAQDLYLQAREADRARKVAAKEATAARRARFDEQVKSIKDARRRLKSAQQERNTLVRQAVAYEQQARDLKKAGGTTAAIDAAAQQGRTLRQQAAELSTRITGVEQEIAALTEQAKALRSFRLGDEAKAASKAVRDARAEAAATRKALAEELQQAAKRQREIMEVARPYLAEHARTAQRIIDYRAGAKIAEGQAGIALASRVGGDLAIPGMRSGALDIWYDTIRAERAAEVAAAAEKVRAARAQLRRAARDATRSDKAAEKLAEQVAKNQDALVAANFKKDIQQWRAEGWRRAAEKLAADIQAGVPALKRRPADLGPRQKDLLEEAIIKDDKGILTISTAAFRKKLRREFGDDAIDWWVSRAGEDQDLWLRALGDDGSTAVTLTPREATLLQTGQRGLLEGLRRTGDDAAAMAKVEALLAIRADPTIRAASFFRVAPAQWNDWVQNQIGQYRRGLDPIRSKLGVTNDDIALITQQATRLAAMARDELMMIAREARTGRVTSASGGVLRAPPSFRVLTADRLGGVNEVVAAQLRYIDSTEPLQVFGRSTIMNTGPDTRFALGRRNMLMDPRTKTGENELVRGLSRMWTKANVRDEQSAVLYAIAADVLDRSTSMADFAAAMKGATQKVFGEGAVDTELKAIGYATRLMAQAAVMEDLNTLMSRTLGGIITAGEAADARRLMTFDYQKIDDLDAAVSALARTGAPMTQSSIRTAEDAAAQTAALVEVGARANGEAIFIPGPMAQAVSDTLDKVIKETYEFYAKAPTHMLKRGLNNFLDAQGLWKASVTLGLGIPTPRYFVNNVVGNFSQIWLSDSLGSAAQSTFQSLVGLPPFIGRPLYIMASRMAEKAAGRPVLGSMVNALWNPHVVRLFDGSPGLFKAANGVVYDYDTVRRWAVEDGVLQSFMQEEYGRLFSRNMGDGLLTRVKFLQDDIFAWGGEIEMRQRMALYTDLLRRGMTRTEAREVTLRAMYDWQDALVPFESAVCTTAIPFYRFYKLALAQTWRETVGLALTKPDQALVKAMLGSSGLARIRQQDLLRRIGTLDDDGDFETAEEKYDALAAYLTPEWLKNRITWTERNDPTRVDLYEASRGKFLPFSAVTLPPFTAIDMMQLTSAPIMGLGVLGLAATGNSENIAPDWYQGYLESVIDMNGPLTKPALEALVESAGIEVNTFAPSNAVTPGQAELAEMLGGQVWWDDNRGAYVTTPTMKAFIANMPLLLQVPQYLEAFSLENPHAATLLQDPVTIQEVQDYSAWAARQLTNFGKRQAFDPQRAITQRQRRFAEELQRRAEVAERPVVDRQIR